MLRALWNRLQQGHRTMRFPAQEPALPGRFRGLPKLDLPACAATRQQGACSACLDACSTGACELASGSPVQIDLGRCLFCGDCATACPAHAIAFSNEYSLAGRNRRSLIVSAEEFKKAEALGDELRALLGRSFKIRQVSAAGCNACEADVNVLGTLAFDLGRFGIQIVASPRHADAILVTGPVSENMRLAVQKTYDAVPAPKLVIAVGSCAVSGGVFRGSPKVVGGVDQMLPVDLYIPGCPPHPITILDGLLRLLGRR